MRQVGQRIYDVCNDCGNIVCQNKWFLRSLHVCTTEDEQRTYSEQINNKACINRKRLASMT